MDIKLITRLRTALLLFSFFLTAQVVAQSYEEGHYQVWFNDSIIATFKFNDSECVLNFKSDSVRPTDKLIVEFVAGKRCSTCKQMVEITDEKRRKIGAMYPSKDLKKMSCIVGRVKEIARSMNSETLYFFYSDEQYHNNTILLKVKFSS